MSPKHPPLIQVEGRQAAEVTVVTGREAGYEAQVETTLGRLIGAVWRVDVVSAVLQDRGCRERECPGFVSSTPINVIVERPDVPTALSVAPSMIKLRFIGDTLPITVLGTFANGSQLDITQSSHLTATVADPTVATVQNGMVTAVGIGNTLGQTTITLQYGQLSATVAVTVPLVQSGDANGDGRVDQADLNIIQAALNTPANGPNDARDLNQDGVINALDASILVTLCTNPGCTSQ